MTSKIREFSPVNTALEHLEKIHRELFKSNESDDKIRIWISGDMPLYFYTGHRMFNEVNVKWSQHILIPPNMEVFRIRDRSRRIGHRIIHVDSWCVNGCNLFAPDWESRCKEIRQTNNMSFYMIDPNDLVISKISRLNDIDCQDIRELVQAGLIDLDLIETLWKQVIDLCIAKPEWLIEQAQKTLEIISEETSNRKYWNIMEECPKILENQASH